MKVNKNIWVGKNKPYNQNSLHFPDGINSGGGTPTPPSGGESGGGRIMYYNLPIEMGAVVLRAMLGWSFMTKGTLATGARVIEPSSGFAMRFSDSHNYASAVAIDWDMTQNIDGAINTMEQVMGMLFDASLGDFNAMIPPISKEQFYSLD